MHVLCIKASCLLRSDTCGFCWYSELISHTHTHTHTHAHTHTHTHTHRETRIHTHTQTVMCSQQLSLLH